MANRLEKFEIKTIKRNEFHGAEYNPRKIDKKAADKLRKFLKEDGLLAPAAIVNKQTMNIVGGHQRISQLDAIFKKDDYDVTVCLVDLTPEDEIKANIKLNNPSMQGEWDIDMLGSLKNINPDIDFQQDFGFDKIDLDYMFAGRDEFAIYGERSEDIEKDINSIKETSDKLREYKKEYRNKLKEINENGDADTRLDTDDYMLTIVFINNKEKHDFMKKINKPIKEKFIKSTILFDLYDHVYKLRELDYVEANSPQ